MGQKELINFINENMELDDFTGGIDEKQINTIQNKLG